MPKCAARALALHRRRPISNKTAAVFIICNLSRPKQQQPARSELPVTPSFLEENTRRRCTELQKAARYVTNRSSCGQLTKTTRSFQTPWTWKHQADWPVPDKSEYSGIIQTVQGSGTPGCAQAVVAHRRCYGECSNGMVGGKSVMGLKATSRWYMDDDCWM